MRIPRTLRTGLLTLAIGLTAGTAAQASVIQREAPFGQGQLSNPVGVTVDQGSGEVYVASFFIGRVNKFGEAGSLISPPSPFGKAVSYFGFSEIFSGVAVDPINNDVYAVDGYGQAIQTYDSATGSLLSQFPIAGATNLYGEFTIVQIASDSAGDVYLPNAPNNEVQEFDSKGNVLHTFTGSDTNTLSAPTGVAVDSAGNVYVADDGNGRVEEFSSSGAFVEAITIPGVQAVAADSAGDVYAGARNAEDSCGSLPSPCFHVVKYGSAPTRAKLEDFGAGTIGSSPEGTINTLAVNDAEATMYVADGGNNEVWVYGPPAKPTVSESTSGVTRTEATLEATVNPQGQGTHYYFEHATGALAPCPASPATGTDLASIYGPQGVSETLSGLLVATLYHYRVVAYNATGVRCGPDRTVVTLPYAPIVTAEAAAQVTSTTATIDGSVNPQGNGNWDTIYEIDYGTTPAYMPLSLHTGDVGSGSAAVAVSAVLSSLAPNTTYHYRIVASNGSGTTYGPDMTFMTEKAPPPAVGTGPASEVTQSSATISGTLDGQDLETTYEFDLGTGTGYGTRVFGEAGLSLSSQTFSVSLRSLAPGTTYHYRLAATNAGGTTYGPDMTFTTLEFPTATLSAPLAPTLVPTPLNVKSPAAHKQVKKRPRKKRTKKNKKGKRSRAAAPANRRGK